MRIVQIKIRQHVDETKYNLKCSLEDEWQKMDWQCQNFLSIRRNGINNYWSSDVRQLADCDGYPRLCYGVIHIPEHNKMSRLK